MKLTDPEFLKAIKAEGWRRFYEVLDAEIQYLKLLEDPKFRPGKLIGDTITVRRPSRLKGAGTWLRG